MLAERPLGLADEIRELPLATPDHPVLEAHIEPRGTVLASVEQVCSVSLQLRYLTAITYNRACLSFS